VKALITGIAGFAGSHLAEHLLAQGDEVAGIFLPQFGTANIAPILPRLRLYAGDLGDYPRLLAILEEARPEAIFHLAAQAAPSLSWERPGETLVNNILSQLHLLEAVVRLKLDPVVLVMGSADEYGLVAPDELPIRESNPLRPNSPYAVSKVAQDYLGYQYFLSHRLRVVRLRPFNHIGPRQGEAFVVASFARQIAMAEAAVARTGPPPAGQEPLVRVGNLTTRRDFTDVRDMVRAYRLAAEKGEPGEVYNVGSERAYGIGEVLERLLALSPLKLRVVQDPERLRAADSPVLLSDSSKFRARTGWRPAIPIEQTLADVLNDWRGRVG